MIAFHCGSVFAMRYDVASNTWTNSSTFEEYGYFQGIGAVTDPSSGLVYLAGGYTTCDRNSMSIYDFDTDSFQPNSPSLPNPATVFAARAYYGNVFSKQRNSILYFGGYNSSLEPIPKHNVVSEYVPTTGYWQSLITSGVPPAMRSDHCMTTNDDGSLVIIYGGRVGANFVNDLYILDTVAQTWRSGTGGMARVYAACTIAGNQLLIWGGRDAYNEIVSTDVEIYNIDTDTWVTTYTPPDSYTSKNSTPNGKGSSSHAGAIAGGVVGGLALIMAAILLFIFRRRRRESRYSRSLANSDYEEEDRKPAAQPTSDTNEEEVRVLRAHIQTQQEELDMQRRLLIMQQERNQEYQRQQLILQQQQLQQDQEELYPSGYSYQPPVNFGTGASTPEPHNYESVEIPLVAQTSTYHPPTPSAINPYPPQPYQPALSPEPSEAMISVTTFGNTRPLENPGNPQFGARERLR
ncbi:Leucine-zipper-like transcriptional regulator 1 [Entomortierella chlamydospora]|uniref:Leucine-zipper-like transcriptional regulator 1 n=1 Tax=Entomortierella chlamydospora TaxID=101097 RepID=A0A9P6SW10_9FUNG|nr:Leucine-zipper-like transcriptional regulator 1 [Entomortierella chlamydospora]KAG0007170.1 Leucine-zipper-like transcriptional regulator 1 [Entomortierella chlamydospora]